MVYGEATLAVRSITMKKHGTKPAAANESILEAKDQFEVGMAIEGFTPGTRKAYGRAFERFAGALKGRSPGEATVKEARGHLSELKRSGAPRGVMSNASAALRFYFEKVRHLQWAPVSPLRQRMIEDMELRGFSPKTQSSYARAVSGLACYHRRSPDQIPEEEIRRYFVHLTCERKLARKTITVALCGIKFFYETTLKRDWSLTGVPVPKREKKLPVILSHKEACEILSHVRVPRHRACLSLIYACGLRLAEGCRVKVSDIDRARGLLHVHGKGSKDRYVPLPAELMPLMEKCWWSHRNPVWLFPWVGRGARQGRISDRHVPLGSVQQAFRAALKDSGVNKAVSVHSLRHAFATNLLEANVPLSQIQKWLGHSSPSTTSIYAHLTAQSTQASARVLCNLMSDLA